MQQRQLRLGDILDDYCPRERRLTNHAVVAMVGPDVKQTRCTTCDAEHEYKHAKVPRQRRKSDAPAALYARALTGRPKRIAHEPPSPDADAASEPATGQEPAPLPFMEPEVAVMTAASQATPEEIASPETAIDAPVPARAPVAVAPPDQRGERGDEEEEPVEREGEDHEDREKGPVHRPLIRASLPRPEGQPPPARPAPEFTIRQPAGRTNRFRPRHARAGQPFHGNRLNGNAGGSARSGMPRQGGGRPPIVARTAKRHDRGRKRSK